MHMPVLQRRTAHHEPGHVVIAADQALRLSPEGIMADQGGSASDATTGIPEVPTLSARAFFWRFSLNITQRSASARNNRSIS
jgi:hypothetical protein